MYNYLTGNINKGSLGEVRPINANRLLQMLSGDRTVYSKRAITDMINSCPTLVTKVTREELERFKADMPVEVTEGEKDNDR